MKTIFVLLVSVILYNKVYAQDLDTLFIKFEKKNIIQKYNSQENYVFYWLQNSGNNGRFYFVEKDKVYFTKHKKALGISDIIKQNNFYSGKNNHKLLDDWKLLEYFEDFNVFMVKNGCIYKLESNYVIG